MNYYKATPSKAQTVTDKADEVVNQQARHRYFILRAGNSAYSMNQLAVSPDKRSLTAVLDTLPASHQLYVKNARTHNQMRYRRIRLDTNVLSEVHFFINPEKVPVNGPYTLSLDAVNKIEIIQKDKGRTTGSYVLGGLGFTVGSLIVVGAIVAAIKSSCPFVSAYDGKDFTLQGEIYGGAIYPQMARDDYMPLRMQPDEDGLLKVKISNELQEIQYTDMAELLVVPTPEKGQVIADEQGSLYAVTSPQAPEKARFSTKETDVLGLLTTENDHRLLNFDDTLADNAQNHVDLMFSRNPAAKKAALILSLKNSYWVDYLYGELIRGFGKYYSRFQQQQARKPVADLRRWTAEQHMPLEVSVRVNGNWQQVASLTTIGPVATRKIVVPIDLTSVTGPVTEIRLSSGFLFWEIDYAAIDYSAGTPVKVERLAVSSAVDEQGVDVRNPLLQTDSVYLKQPVPGNVATLAFRSQLDPGQHYSYILHTRGYYTHVRNFSQKPDLRFLKQFKQPNAFPAFSLARFRKLYRSDLRSIALH